jgi:uncharacterized protein YgfB (UPF0149 family)
MSESSGITWSTSEAIRSESDYNTRLKIADDIQAVIDRCSARGMSTHFISGLELARGITLKLTKEHSEYSELDNSTLF